MITTKTKLHYHRKCKNFKSFFPAHPVLKNSELKELYRKSCQYHAATPNEKVLESLESLNLPTATRSEVLNLRDQTLTYGSCEALEELFKWIQYRSIDVSSCGLDDVSGSALFDMIEYYEATNELNISENSNIKNRGWQACINMIKRSRELHTFATRSTPLSDNNASQLGTALLTSYIYTLKLEHCGLSGRPILSLCGHLKKNTILRELCLANNELNCNDAYHISTILKSNMHLQLLDISNNDVQVSLSYFIA
jgi:protein phosphatase 1 regulatory subunit 37